MTVLTFDNYQAYARKAAGYPQERAIMYPAGLLIEEVGALMQCFNQPMRDGGEVARRCVVDKLGDCLWAITALASDLGLSLSHAFDANEFLALEARVFAGRSNPEMAAIHFCRNASQLAFNVLDSRQKTARNLLVQLCFAEAVNQMQVLVSTLTDLDITLIGVAYANLDKLVECGAIGGDGANGAGIQQDVA